MNTNGHIVFFAKLYLFDRRNDTVPSTRYFIQLYIIFVYISKDTFTFGHKLERIMAQNATEKLVRELERDLAASFKLFMFILRRAALSIVRYNLSM